MQVNIKHAAVAEDEQSKIKLILEEVKKHLSQLEKDVLLAINHIANNNDSATSIKDNTALLNKKAEEEIKKVDYYIKELEGKKGNFDIILSL